MSSCQSDAGIPVLRSSNLEILPSMRTFIPRGVRPPDGITWSHDENDFWLLEEQEIVCSRSMLQEAGVDIASEDIEPLPRSILAWPLLNSGQSTASGATDNITKDPYLNDPPRLEEFIDREDLPDYLVVHDSDGRTFANERQPTDYPRFKVYVRKDRPGSLYGSPRIMSLDLEKPFDQLGKGTHSSVHSGHLRLPEKLYNGRDVSVAVKITKNHKTDQKHLRNEAREYSIMPPHLQEDWTGFHAMPGNGGIQPVKAVVPKFYGYYEFVTAVHEPDCGEEERDGAKTSSEMESITCVGPQWTQIEGAVAEAYEKGLREGPGPHPQSFMLLEECGTPIEITKLTEKQRDEIWSLGHRLHMAGISQQSFFKRNLLWQPGPLHLPPALRTMDNPSFRVIDFGRAKSRPVFNTDEWLDVHVSSDYDAMIGILALSGLSRKNVIQQFCTKALYLRTIWQNGHR